MTQLAKFLLTMLCLLPGLLFVTPAECKLTGSLSAEAIEKRLQPMGQVKVFGQSADGTIVAPTGKANVGGPEQIYNNNCKMCHGTGLAGAPRLGNKADWAPRVSQGMDVLYHAAVAGIRAMPPKGNCLQCSEEDIKKTVQYMVNSVK